MQLMDDKMDKDWISWPGSWVDVELLGYFYSLDDARHFLIEAATA